MGHIRCKKCERGDIGHSVWNGLIGFMPLLVTMALLALGTWLQAK